MQALTKLNPADPVRFDSMNAILGEIEGKDDELAKQINDCLHSNKNLILEQDIIEYIKSLSTPETFYAGRCTNAPEENSYFVVSVFIGGSDKHIVASQFNAYGACRKWQGDIWNNEFKGWQQTATTDTTSTNKVLMNLEEVNNPNLESGIYSCEGVRILFSSSIPSDYFMLIVNKHRLNPGFGTQIAIPYDSGVQRGIYYRICAAGTWGNWLPLAETKCADIVLNGYSQGFITPRVLKMGNTYTISGDFNLPSAVPSGTVIGTIPVGFLPIANFHIFLDAYQIQLPFNARLWVTTDGNIALHGCDHLPIGATLEFNKTIIVP